MTMHELEKKEEGEGELLSLYEVIRSEVNLLIFPFFALDDKDVKRRKELEFKALVERDGKKLEVIWNVSANAKFGFPGPFDRKVHKALEEILTELKLPIQNPILLGSLYNLCKRIGLVATGPNYEKIKAALRRITATSIQSKGTFYLKGRKRWVEDVFHLYERVVFKGEQLPEGVTADENRLFLNTWYLDNLNSGYTKPLDYAYYKSLKDGIAQRLYELLGVKFFGLVMQGKPSLQYSYFTLCQLLPLKPQQQLKYARRQLKSAHEMLQETGFLNYDWQGWMICYHPGPRVIAEINNCKALKAPYPPDEPLLALSSPSKGRLSTEERAQIRCLLEDILAVVGDEHSKHFYIKIAKLALEKPRLQDLIYRCLSEVKYEAHEGLIRTTKGAVFTDKIKRYCKERGINLGLRESQGSLLHFDK